MSFNFPTAFKEKMLAEAPSFDVIGLLSADGNVYPIGTDTKVLSTVFELLARPLLCAVASESSLVVREPAHQNYYPDFTLMRNESDRRKIAVDVKTTYRRFNTGGQWRASFTLGSYTSVLRNGTKNIVFPYGDYFKHYIIGFIYTRSEREMKDAFALGQLERASGPYKDVEWFVQEKFRIAGERAGSGNTTNVGSIVASSIEECAAGNGPFAQPGEGVFLDYWRNYGTTAATRAYRSLSEYYAWKTQV